MDLRIKGKTALVTGGSRGIGYGVAKLLAEDGELLIAKAKSEETAKRFAPQAAR